jgi:hypothetical protein
MPFVREWWDGKEGAKEREKKKKKKKRRRRKGKQNE